MNAYDFDGTVYNGDSAVDFYLFCMRRHPTLAATLAGNLVAAAKFKLGFTGSADFKGRFLASFVSHLNIDGEVRLFWRANRRKVKEWYHAQALDDDVIISASPHFLLAPLCDELGVALIATEVDVATGRLSGPNMRGREKVAAFRAAFPGVIPDCFYTDDLKSDAPMVMFARKAFLVRGKRVTPLAAT